MAEQDLDWYGDGSTLTQADGPAPEPDPRALRWPRARVLIASVAAFLVLCGGAWWLTHPGAVRGYFGGTTWSPQPLGSVLAVDAGLYWAESDAPPTTYPVDSVRLAVDLRGNDDRVRVSWAVCDLTGNGRIGSALITGGTGVGGICSRLAPFEQGQAVDLATQQVLLLAEPLTSEPFEIGPATATYRVGLRAETLTMPGTVGFNVPFDAAP